MRIGPLLSWFAVDRGNLDFGPGPTLVGGARWRARVSSPLSLEAGVGLGSSSRRVIDPLREEGPSPADTVSSTWVRLEAGGQIALTGARTWNRLQPYVLLGGGLIVGVSEESSEVFADTAQAEFRYKMGTLPLFQAGLGTEILLSDRMGVAFELRNYLLRLKAPSGFFRNDVLQRIEEAGGEAPRLTEWPMSPELSVGLWYYF